MGSIEEPTTCNGNNYPPFSTEVKTAPLTSVSLKKLQENDEKESTAFFDSCKGFGFLYLQLDDSPLGQRLLQHADQLHEIQRQFFSRPNPEKKEFMRGKVDFFGYRFTAIDGPQKRNEMYNLRKDDVLEQGGESLPNHPLFVDNRSLIRDFVLECREVIDLMTTHLETNLQLEPGTLAKMQRVGEPSGDHVRFTQSCVQTHSERVAASSEHSDFGTLTVLFNWLGGLQIRTVDTKEWVYVKPQPGKAIINLGDALVKFTAGILNSNVHRIAAPPPPQEGLVRNSLVYFARPEDNVMLQRVKGGLVDAQPDDSRFGEDMTAKEWILRRSIGNLKGVFTREGGLEAKSSYDAKDKESA